MKNKFVALIILFTSILAFAGACYFYFDTKGFLAEAATTEGTVIELVRKSSSDNQDTFAPTFQFKDQSGKEHTIESSTSSNPPAYSVNEKVKLFYLEDNPKEARIDGFVSLWGAATIFMSMSGMSFIVGICFFLFKR